MLYTESITCPELTGSEREREGERKVERGKDFGSKKEKGGFRSRNDDYDWILMLHTIQV